MTNIDNDNKTVIDFGMFEEVGICIFKWCPSIMNPHINGQWVILFQIMLELGQIINNISEILK